MSLPAFIRCTIPSIPMFTRKGRALKYVYYFRKAT